MSSYFSVSPQDDKETKKYRDDISSNQKLLKPSSAHLSSVIAHILSNIM